MEESLSQREKYFYNINDHSKGILRQLGEGLKTRIFPGEQAMVSIVSIESNSKGKIHSHPQEQWSYLVEGNAIRIQDGEEISVKKGDFWCTPGGIKHGIIGGPEGAVIFDVFAPQREEYKKPGSGFAAD